MTYRQDAFRLALLAAAGFWPEDLLGRAKESPQPLPETVYSMAAGKQPPGQQLEPHPELKLRVHGRNVAVTGTTSIVREMGLAAGDRVALREAADGRLVMEKLQGEVEGQQAATGGKGAKRRASKEAAPGRGTGSSARRAGRSPRARRK